MHPRASFRQDGSLRISYFSSPHKRTHGLVWREYISDRIAPYLRSLKSRSRRITTRHLVGTSQEQHGFRRTTAKYVTVHHFITRLAQITDLATEVQAPAPERPSEVRPIISVGKIVNLAGHLLINVSLPGNLFGAPSVPWAL